MQFMTNFSKWRNINKVFFVLLLGGVILRLLKAWYFTPVLTQDEASLYLSSQMNSFFQHIFRTREYFYSHYTSPPLFFLLSKIWITFTTNTFLLRIPTIICSFITLLISWKSVKLIDLKSKENNAIINHLLPFYVSFSLFFIFYGVIYRTYSLGILLATLTIYFLLKILNAKRPTTTQLFCFGFFLWLGLMTNYGLVWLCPPIASVLLLNYKRVKKLAHTFIITLLLYLPWMIVFFRDISTMITLEGRGFESGSFSGGFLEIISKFYIGSYSLLRNVIHHNTLIYIIAGIMLLSLAGMIRTYSFNKKLSVFLLSGTIIPYGIVLAFTYFSHPVVDYKNLFFPNLLTMIGFILFLTLLKTKSIKYLFLSSFVVFQTSMAIVDLPKHRRGPNIPKNVYSEILKNLNGPTKNIKIIAEDRELDPLIVYGSWKYQMNIQTYDFNSKRMTNVPKDHRPLYFLSLFDDYEKSKLSKTLDDFDCELQAIPTKVHLPLFGKCRSQ